LHADRGELHAVLLGEVGHPARARFEGAEHGVLLGGHRLPGARPAQQHDEMTQLAREGGGELLDVPCAGHQPRSARRWEAGISLTLMPTMASPRPRDTLAITSGSS